MNNYNFLLKAFCNQFPPKIEIEVIEKEDYHIIRIKNPDKRINNYFGPYFEEGTSDIVVVDNEYSLLMELCRVINRYSEY